MRPLRRAALLAAFILPACSGSTPSDTGDGTARENVYHVLFIGNSLTYENNLPRALTSLVYDGGDSLVTSSASYANYALIDHYNGTSDAKRLIALRHWDHVVMQQGPTTSPGLDRDTLILAAQLFAPLIREAGAQPAMYMVWTERSRLELMPEVEASYRAAADSVNGEFFPVGAAWLKAWQHDPNLALYDVDEFHPSRMGTYLAALIMYEHITHRDARLLPAHANVDGDLRLSAETFKLLQETAHETNAAYGLVTDR